jgi:replicative DNA helicase
MKDVAKKIEGNEQEAAEELVKIGTDVKLLLSSDPIEQMDECQLLAAAKQEYEKLKQAPVAAWGTRTGFTTLDNATFGIAPGELFIVAARPGCGKSMWLLSSAINMFQQGKKVVYFSIEMPITQLRHRMWANISKTPTKQIAMGNYDQETLTKVETFLNNSLGGKFVIVDSPNITAPAILARIEKLDFTPDVVVVDYLGIVKASDSKLQDNLAQAAVVEELRAIGRQKKVGILSAVQLNRDPGKSKHKTKGTERLARSDVIAATADVIIQVEEQDIDESILNEVDSLNLVIIKNRKGEAPLGFKVRKMFDCARMEDWDLGWQV